MTHSRALKTVQLLCPIANASDAEAFLQDFFKTLPLSLVLGIHLLFWIFWWAPFLAIHRFKTLGKLTEAECERYFAWWEAHPWYFIREALGSLKTFALMAQVGCAWEPPA